MKREDKLEELALGSRADRLIKTVFIALIVLVSIVIISFSTVVIYGFHVFSKYEISGTKVTDNINNDNSTKIINTNNKDSNININNK